MPDKKSEKKRSPALLEAQQKSEQASVEIAPLDPTVGYPWTALHALATATVALVVMAEEMETVDGVKIEQSVLDDMANAAMLFFTVTTAVYDGMQDSVQMGSIDLPAPFFKTHD